MKAMVLAAGLGTRLRPLTETTPKPLVKVNNVPLIEYAFNLLRKAGVTEAVVNCHYLADQIEEYVANTDGLDVKISDERAALLETGGGVKKALPILQDDVFAVLNSDVIVKNDTDTSLKIVQDQWDADEMDILILLQSKETAVGYDGRGDFHLNDNGVSSRPEQNEDAPYIFTGIQIVKSELFDKVTDEKFSMNVLFDNAIKRGRLYGVVHDGMWLHVGTETALKEAEAILACV